MTCEHEWDDDFQHPPWCLKCGHAYVNKHNKLVQEIVESHTEYKKNMTKEEKDALSTIDVKEGSFFYKDLKKELDKRTINIKEKRMKNVFGGDEKDKKIVEVDSHQILANEHRPEIYGRTWVKIGTSYHSIPNRGFFIKTVTEWQDAVEKKDGMTRYNSPSGADICIFRDGVALMDVMGISIVASIDDIAAPMITIHYAPQHVEIEAENPKLVEIKDDSCQEKK